MPTELADPLPPSVSLQELVDNLAERLQRSVALDDPGIALIVASRHFGDEDDVRVRSVLERGVSSDIRDAVLALGIAHAEGPQRIGPLGQFGAKARVCVPVRCDGVLLGFLWLIDDGRIGDEDIRDARAVADMAGLVLYHRDLIAQRRLARCSAAVRDLISPDDSTRTAAVAEAIEEGLLPPLPHIVVGVVRVIGSDGVSTSASAALRQVAYRATRTGSEHVVLCSVRSSELIVLDAHRSEPQAPTRVIERVRRDVSGRTKQRVVAGVGGTWSDARQSRQVYRQAVVASRAAQSFSNLGDVVVWESLGVYALLAMLDPQQLSLTPCSAALTRLASDRSFEVLLVTVETFLDCAGSVQRATRALHIHRATLYQRLARIQEVTGLDLDDGGTRLSLHLDIKIARLIGRTSLFSK